MNLGMPEMIFIFLLALIIFGPRKLPEIGRQLGKAMLEFKRASNTFQTQLEDEIRQLELHENRAKTIHAVPVPPPEGTVTYTGAGMAEGAVGHTPEAVGQSGTSQGHDA